MPHILLVEDEDHLAIGIRYNLTSEGLTVTTAADGHDALAVLDEPNADIDLVGTGCNAAGPEWLRCLRRDSRSGQPDPGSHAHSENAR